eukprot:10740520-Alexandrium_andersonii.AAC.1
MRDLAAVWGAMSEEQKQEFAPTDAERDAVLDRRAQRHRQHREHSQPISPDATPFSLGDQDWPIAPGHIDPCVTHGRAGLKACLSLRGLAADQQPSKHLGGPGVGWGG